MNRVFKVIWNRTKGCYVVVAETAKNMTKRSSLSVVFSKMVGATAVAVMLAGVMMPTDTYATSITRGDNAYAENDGGIAVGDKTVSKGNYSVSIGSEASVGKGDTDENNAQNGIAIGHNATVKVDHAGDPKIQDKSGGIAIGHTASTTEINAIAIGTGSKVTAAQAVAVGRNSKVFVHNGVAMGNETRVNSLNGFALGNNARAGYDDTDAPITGKDNDQAFGSNARAWGGSSMAFGNNAKAGGGGDISMGNGSQSRAQWGVAIGNGAKALGQAARAIGANSTASGINSAAMGWDSVASGASSIAIGETSKATAEHSIAMSTSANVASEDAIAIGHNAQVDASQQRSIALGANSKTANVVSTPNQLVNGLWYQNYAGGSADSTLSVGSDTLKRTITNVAAGRVNAQSTDAINGSQLYGVANTLGNLASTTKGILGGNAALDPDTGNLSMSNIGNTGKGTIHDAIKFNKDTIDKGLNFDANTGGAKNNLLGSKVTIKGDGSNINAAITQANGDTTINMTLGNTIKVGTAKPVTIDGTTGHVTGLQNKDWNVDNPVAVSGRAATEDQLKKVNDKVNTNKADIDKNAGDINTNKQNITKNAGDIANNKTDIAKNKQDISTINTTISKGLNFDGDSGAVINKKLGEKLSVKGGATGTLSDGNIGVESDGNGTLNVKLAKTLSGLDSVTAGGTTINNSGLTVGGKTYVSPTGINANDQKVTNVANGDVSANSKDAVNGGQLHNAKNELINKGLRFDADNNAEKTNKLGSKVTVNGDNNITTEITQTGDDTTIGVKLNKNLNVTTLTATDTVKAGSVTMGKHADSNNYVTGLDNKDWDVNTSNPVSGRAATEDQLRKISDVIKSQGTAATDYRLVKNAAAADGAYTVDSNGDVDLTVEDKNHAGSKETVKIKDVASKSKLDKVINDGLKFDANTGGEKTNKLGSKVSVKGDNSNIITSISQDANGDSTIDVKLGKDLKTETITATGKDGKDGKIGINGKDGVTTNISVTRDGKPGVDGAAGTTTTRIVYQKPDGTNEEVANLNDGMMYGGDTGNVIKKKLNNQVNVKGGISDESKLATEDNIGVVSDGSDTLKLRLAKELKGLTSATFTNGGNNTVINGDGMTINRAGGNAVSLTKDGLNNGGNKITNVADGTDPNDAVNKSQLDKATAAASTTVSAGNNITVTPSTNANGSKNYEVSLKDQVTLGSDATKQIALDGTTGTIKAGDKVTIDGNKGTIKAGNVTIDGENGTIKAGDKVTIDGKDGKIAAGKVSVDGKDGYVTGLENKDWDPNNITSGRAATEDQLQKSHKALDNKINNLGDEITKKGMNFAGNTGEFHRDLGQKVTIKGEGTEADDKYSGENIKTVADQNGNVTIKMAKDLKTDSLTTDKVKVGKNGKDGVSITGPNGVDGTDGKVGITGKDGKDAVSMSGKDGVGHIGLTGKDGRNADITVDKGDPDLDGNNITRIKYQDENGKTHQVATKDDGMKYGGDSGSVIKKKLNEQVNVVGGITDASKLTTEDNLGVVSDGTGNLKVRMAKDLKGLETVTTKDAAGNTTVMNGGGVTITPASGNAVSLTKDGLNNGGNTITNVGPGVNGTDAVNVNQLKGATDGLANAINSVAGETQRVGAHAAAMSALKPIQYDPLEPTQVMAGIGNYRGETAAALGVAHYTAEDTMFHVGVSVGSHHNMVNAGVTRKFGTSDAKKAVPERYKGGPISSMYVMQDEMTALKAKYEKVQRDNEEMRAQIALLMQQAGLK